MRKSRLLIPSPRTAVEHGQRPRLGMVAPEGGHAERRAAPATCRAARSMTRARRRAARAPDRSPGRGRCRARRRDRPARRHARGSMSPETATTVFAGRYVVDQKSRIVSAGSARMPSSSPQISRPSGPSPNIACWNRIWPYSDGSSRYERISSTITVRSLSISRSSSLRPDDQLAEDVDRPAPRRAPGRAPSRRSTRGRWRR